MGAGGKDRSSIHFRWSSPSITWRYVMHWRVWRSGSYFGKSPGADRWTHDQGLIRFSTIIKGNGKCHQLLQSCSLYAVRPPKTRGMVLLSPLRQRRLEKASVHMVTRRSLRNESLRFAKRDVDLSWRRPEATCLFSDGTAWLLSWTHDRLKVFYDFG